MARVSTLVRPPELIGIAGLGRMGAGIAGTLLAKGFRVIGWDPVAARQDLLHSFGGSTVNRIASLRQARTLILSLPSEQALEAVVSELCDSLEDATCVVIETSTLPLSAKRHAQERLWQTGVTLLDAPVVGGALQAAQGALTVLASGPRDAYEANIEVFDGFGAKKYYVGAFGEATKFKLVINHLVGVSNLLFAETVQIAQLASLDTRLLKDIISASSLGSGLWSARAAVMVDRAWGDATRQSGTLTIPLKDTALIADFLRERGARAPLLEATLPIYQSAQQRGMENLDPSVLLEVLEGLNAAAGARTERST